MQQLKKWFASFPLLQFCLHMLPGESAMGWCRCRGMSAGFQHLVFRYDKSYSKGNIDQLCLDLFTDQHIRQRFKVAPPLPADPWHPNIVHLLEARFC